MARPLSDGDQADVEKMAAGEEKNSYRRRGGARAKARERTSARCDEKRAREKKKVKLRRTQKSRIEGSAAPERSCAEKAGCGIFGSSREANKRGALENKKSCWRGPTRSAGPREGSAADLS